jgi:hypothetical protein
MLLLKVDSALYRFEFLPFTVKHWKIPLVARTEKFYTTCQQLNGAE